MSNKHQVGIVSDATCQAAHIGLSTITDDMLCAGGQGGEDSCQVSRFVFVFCVCFICILYLYFQKLKKCLLRVTVGGPLQLNWVENIHL